MKQLPLHFLITALFLPTLLYAQTSQKGEFVPLSDLSAEFTPSQDPGAFLNLLFQYGIVIAGILAVFMLVWAGFEYMTTEAVSGKSEAKKKITDVLSGLLLILLSYIILSIINPDILSFSFFNIISSTP